MDANGDEEEIDQIICLCGRLIQVYLEKYIQKTPCMTSSQTGYIWLMEVLEGNESRCYNQFRMDKQVFMMLVNDLEKILKGSRNMSIVEMLAMFLYILGQGQSNRNTQERFQRSGETVSRYFDIMLEIFYNMAKVLIKPLDPEFRSIPQEILTDSRYMPHFKDCIGAIDGVHVQASISPCDQVPYIGRKWIPTQNVLAICNFDMQFTFACAGWEGTAHDSRVFLSTLRNPQSNFPKPPNGKYYVVDAGYPQMKGFLGPYKGERYHLPHFRRGDEPTGHKEIFNHAHSSLRGVIERTFGVWKKKWSILRDMPHFPYKKQVKIVIATMALHNYIRRYAQRDIDFDESGNYSSEETSEETSEEMEDNEHDGDGPGRREMEVLRNAIAQSLMNAST